MNVASNPTEWRDSQQAEQELLGRPGIERVRILGINALGILHRHAADLTEILRGGGILEVLLLDPESDEFRQCRDRQEKSKGKVSNRIAAEMEASIATLRDILNHLLHRHNVDAEDLAARFNIRFHDRRIAKSHLFVESPGQRALLFRKIPAVPPLRGSAARSKLVTAKPRETDSIYLAHETYFAEIWNESKIVSLEFLSSDIEIVAPRKSDASHIYAQAMELHKKRHLDEASELYRTVLKLEKPRDPSEKEMRQAQRFLPRIFTTRLEPFGLRDLAVLFHPDKSKRLIGYHLIWEDDIDYLDDNDPADHEVIWIKHGKDEQVEEAWSFAHGSILSTSKAVADANANDGRVKVCVQWGKHASLLEGWEEKIGVDQPLPGEPGFESLQFGRLSKGRNETVGHYGDRWPKRFEGNLSEFVDFAAEIDMEEIFARHRMVAVSEYPNAVISEWFLPYNIYPKLAWPYEAVASVDPWPERLAG